MVTSRADMVVVHGVDALGREHGRLFLVIGVFDGLHLGHGYLLEQLVQAARVRAARPAVLTFDHHPDEVVRGAAPPLLLDPQERIERLAEAGVELTVVQTFDQVLRDTPYDAFVRRIAERVELAGFLMTPESAFGHRREGTPATVAGLGRELGYEVVVVPQLTLDGAPVSSSAIRRAIEAGDLGAAARLLGRDYAVVGTVVPEGDVTALDFALPVALPPPGRWAVALGTRGRNGDAGVLERGAEVTGDHRLIVPGLRVGFEERVTFVSG